MNFFLLLVVFNVIFNVFSYGSLIKKEDFCLIWVCSDSNRLFQKEWIKELLSDFNFIEKDQTNLNLLANKSILVITDSLDAIQMQSLIDLKNNDGIFGAFHLGDEAYIQDVTWYSLSDFVFREYYQKNYLNFNPRLEFIPLGCKQGFAINMDFKTLIPSNKRTFDWSFIGQIDKSNRKIMLNYLSSLRAPFFTNFNASFGLDVGLKTKDYQHILLNTKLAPCPLGWINPDSFRLYESLECGCVPIVEDPNQNYFSALYDNPPFLILQNWSQLKKTITPFLDDPEKLEKKRKECFMWYLNEKIKIKNKIKKYIKELLEK